MKVSNIKKASLIISLTLAVLVVLFAFEARVEAVQSPGSPGLSVEIVPEPAPVAAGAAVNVTPEPPVNHGLYWDLAPLPAQAPFAPFPIPVNPGSLLTPGASSKDSARPGEPSFVIDPGPTLALAVFTATMVVLLSAAERFLKGILANRRKSHDGRSWGVSFRLRYGLFVAIVLAGLLLAGCGLGRIEPVNSPLGIEDHYFGPDEVPSQDGDEYGPVDLPPLDTPWNVV